MTLRLAGGIVPGPGTGVWAFDPAGIPGDAAALNLPPGTPVAVGPVSTVDTALARALTELASLIAAHGPVVAGAGLDLGDGIESARTEGGAGDRRDAMLAALEAGLSDRLGPRQAVLVSLFGPDATKPLGAAAHAAVTEHRWAALRLAVAASDVLGPEQLADVVAWQAPSGVEPFPAGLASVTGAHFAMVLQAVPGPRRLSLVKDLWAQVCTQVANSQRRQRLAASQVKQSRLEDILARNAHYAEDELRQRVSAELGSKATFSQIALWKPSPAFWLTKANRVLHDAQAATVLARLAVSAVDTDAETALAKHWHEIEAVAGGMTQHEAALSARQIPGLSGLPARPGSHLRDIYRRAQRRGPRDLTFERSRMAFASDYAYAAMQGCTDLFYLFGDPWEPVSPGLGEWADSSLADWRAKVGYLSPDRVPAWNQRPLTAGSAKDPLCERPGDGETVGDLLWYAELADALAQLSGLAAAKISYRAEFPDAEPNLFGPPEPLVPRYDSIALAAAATAQLTELGGRVPRRPRGWEELVAGLLETAAMTESLTGVFTVPAEVADADATVLPGTGARIEIARNGRQLAEWADYMGNCIAGPGYQEAARDGRAALVALRTEDGSLVANAELRPSAHGWHVKEIKGRFNGDADAILTRQTRSWASSLAVPATMVKPAVREIWERPAAGAGRSPAVRLTRSLGESLQETAKQAMAEASAQVALRTMASIAEPRPNPFDTMTALRRESLTSLAGILGKTLAVQDALADMWAATAIRPFQQAVAAEHPSDVDRLAPLFTDAPLPGYLRILSRLPHIAPARTAHLVALRLRRSLGLLVGHDDHVLAQAIVARPHAAVIKAAALTVTSWGGLPGHSATAAITAPRKVSVPGYPATTLDDEGWQASWPDAGELGAHMDRFWEQLAERGLLLPASWLRHTTWPVFWSRAVR